jgi:hypothetical protein
MVISNLPPAPAFLQCIFLDPTGKKYSAELKAQKIHVKSRQFSRFFHAAGTFQARWPGKLRVVQRC